MNDYAPPKLGDLVKVRLEVNPPVMGCEAERMWTRVTEVNGESACGILDNDPVVRTDLKCGQEVTFDLADILEI
jgi:uncharacterized protein YegJ (DUF2314 family)